MKTRLFLLVGVCLIATTLTFAQNQPKKEYYAGECARNEITIDGRLDEAAWQKATWQDDFTQYEPSEGKNPSQKTEFAILLDENFIYVGFKCFFRCGKRA